MDSELKDEDDQDVIFDLRRKLNSSENARLNVISSSNEEISRLLSEVARLTAQSERGEALRQNLEYDLAKAKKEISLERKVAEDCNAEIQKLIGEFTRKEEKIISEKKTLTRELDVIRTATQDDISRFAILLQEKEKQLTAVLKEKDRLIAEKSDFALIIKDRDRTIGEFKVELERLAAYEQQQETSVRSRVQKVEQLRDQIGVLEQELLMTLNKVDSLEAEKEVEKKNHFQTKYNCEVLQNELKAETDAKAEAVLELEKMQDHSREIQESFEAEKLSSSELRAKLADLEREFEAMSKRLSSESAEKKKLVKSYSVQLDECQKTANQLKQELGKARKKQTQLDEAYNSGIKDLQEIISLFSSGSLRPSSSSSTAAKAAAAAATAPNTGRETAKTNAFGSVVSAFRLIYHESVRQFDKFSRELSNQQQTIDQLTKECKSYKLKMTTTAKASQMSVDALEKMNGEKKLLESERLKLESDCGQLRKDLNVLKSGLAKEKLSSQDLQDQVLKLGSKFQSNEQRYSTFVLLLHQMLNTVDEVAAFSGKCSASKDGALPKWSELGLIVNEQVSALVNLLNQEKEKVSRSDELLRQKERALEQLYVTRDEELTKVAKMYESSNQQWNGEKEELQKQYLEKLSDFQSKHKTSSDESWQKLKTANGVQQELEQDCENLLGQLNASRFESGVLLATCALLCGTFYPLHARYVALVEQRATLSGQLVQFESFKNQVKSLIVAISGDSCDSVSKIFAVRKSGLGPALRFRVAVIAVMAVRRLFGFAGNGCRLFTSFNVLPGVYATSVCFGGLETMPQGAVDSSDAEHSDRLVGWLSSADLRSSIHSSMEDLMLATRRANEGGAPGYETERLVNIAKSCFQKFLSLLPKMFPPISVDHGSRSSCCQLRKGLESCLGSCSNRGHSSYINSQQLAKNLQQELLGFTQRLHASELERRDLRGMLSLVEKGVVDVKRQEPIGRPSEELTPKKEQFENVVPTSKFTQVCEELALALEREEQLQTILGMQKEQLAEQAERLSALNDRHQENTSRIAEKHSTDLQVEIHSKDQLVQRLTRQISILDEEKSSLRNKVSDAEHALNAAAREKQMVIDYANALSKWFRQLPSAEDGKWDVDALLNFETADAKPSAELSAVQNLLSAFIETMNVVLESKSFSFDDFLVKNKSKGKSNPNFRPEAKISKNKESFRPFVIESDPGPLKVKVDVKESKTLQKKPADKKLKSRLPRHQGLRALTRRVMSSHRYPLSGTDVGGPATPPTASRNASKLIIS